jgi:hypothetical protein
LKKPSRHGRTTVILLCLLLCISVAIVAVLLIKVQVLKIGDFGPFFRVVNGNIITLRYTHSMYGVSVTERLRVENGCLELFHVVTSDAALEYFGIEGKDENNVKNSLKEFTIPKESVGRHTLSIQGHEILLSNIRTKDQKIHIIIIKQPLVSYYIDSIWR